jgi:hypothetical protein
MIYRRSDADMITVEDKMRLEHLTTKPYRPRANAVKRGYIDWPAVVVYHLTLVIACLVVWGIGQAIGL